eukprot:m.232992 g.232992  ORF g.232992 m.232992 type:complete len:91 (-) comp16022_c0_seq34:1140-1412(-)
MEPNAKPCKVCHGFGEAFKKTKPKPKIDEAAHAKNENNKVASMGDKYGCPENSETLGKGSWSMLHTMAAYYPEKPNITTQVSCNNKNWKH